MFRLYGATLRFLGKDDKSCKEVLDERSKSRKEKEPK